MLRVLLCLLILGTVPLAGQSIRSVTPLPDAWGNAEVWAWVDADANPATKEAIVRRFDTWQYAVVRVRPDGSLCPAPSSVPWFYWASDPYTFPTVARGADGRDFVYATVSNHYVEFSITVPPGC